MKTNQAVTQEIPISTCLKMGKRLKKCAVLIWLIPVNFSLAGNFLLLHPGSYLRHTFHQPVVLSEAGKYEFTQCDFMINHGDTGLRIHPGAEVVVNTCQFIGWEKEGHVGIGLFTESTLQVKDCYFLHLQRGIYYRNASGPEDDDGNPSNDPDVIRNRFEGLDVGIRKDGAGKLSVVGNTFTNNATAIELGYSGSGPAVGTVDPVDIAFNFKCNSFVTNEAVNRTGLLIENGVRVNGDGNIGGSAVFDPDLYTNPYPNANYFPVKKQTPAINRGAFPEVGGIEYPVQHVSNGWPDALNWKSINNQTGCFALGHHRDKNRDNLLQGR